MEIKGNLTGNYNGPSKRLMDKNLREFGKVLTFKPDPLKTFTELYPVNPPDGLPLKGTFGKKGSQK